MSDSSSDTLRAEAVSPRQRNFANQLFELVSSMRFAISLLTLLAVASIVGTVLKQNEPYNNYLNQFGPFWFPLFESLGLYAVYNAVWFLVILAFLVLSTSLCIARQTPHMLKEMRSWREHAQEVSLRQFAHHAEIAGDAGEQAQGAASHYLVRQGFRVRTVVRDDGTLIVARAGRFNRLGYFLAHIAIVLICLGGLLDGNLPLKLQMWLGNKQILQGAAMMGDVPASARLGDGNFSFRGNLFVPEGKSQSAAVLNVRDGILIQELPFSLSLKKFTIDHYTTGAPKRFASEVVVTDRKTGEQVERTIEVNKPFTFNGITIYQASFEDGGSQLQLHLKALKQGVLSQAFQAEVGVNQSIGTGDSARTLEVTGFRPINVENMAVRDDSQATSLAMSVNKHLGSAVSKPGDKDLHDVGPSFSYKLRDAAGQAREYNTFMRPVQQDGRWWMISGMRNSPQEEFRFLRMPLDDEGKLDTFLSLHAAIQNPALTKAIANRFAQTALQQQGSNASVRPKLVETAERTLTLFQVDGLKSVADFIETQVPAPQREAAAGVFLKVLYGCVWEAWQMQREADHLPAQDLDEARAMFVRAVLAASSDTLHYGAPYFLQLSGYNEVKASVFQVTRSPGQPVVYLGSALLVAGILCMLYIRERRLYLWRAVNAHSWLIAMSANRRSLDVGLEFAKHQQALTHTLSRSGAAPGQ